MTMITPSYLGETIEYSSLHACRSTLEDPKPHVCRGLNTCKGKGGCGATKGKNACAGQGGCATAAKHDCKGQNACKGEGGCGATPGKNACKGKGSCAVPLSDKTWAKARATFEAAMKKAGKEFGSAPPKKAA